MKSINAAVKEFWETNPDGRKKLPWYAIIKIDILNSIIHFWCIRHDQTHKERHFKIFLKWVFRRNRFYEKWVPTEDLPF